MRSAPTLTLAVATVATALAGTRRSHRASGRASTRRMAAPQRRTQVLGQSAKEARDEHENSPQTTRTGPGTAGLRYVRRSLVRLPPAQAAGGVHP